MKLNKDQDIDTDMLGVNNNSNMIEVRFNHSIIFCNMVTSRLSNGVSNSIDAVRPTTIYYETE